MQYEFFSPIQQSKTDFFKLTKCDCSTSNKTIVNLKCRVRPLSLTLGSLNAEFTFLKQTTDFFVTFSFHFKHQLGGGKFRQIFIFRDLKGCDLSEMAVSNFVLKPMLEWFNETFQGIIHKCPYEGTTKFINITMDGDNSANQKFYAMQNLPNGEYKFNLKLYNSDDDNILNFNFFCIMKSRKGTLNGDEDF